MHLKYALMNNHFHNRSGDHTTFFEIRLAQNCLPKRSKIEYNDLNKYLYFNEIAVCSPLLTQPIIITSRVNGKWLFQEENQLFRYKDFGDLQLNEKNVENHTLSE